MAKYLLCTGSNVFLSGNTHLSPASILVDKVSGKITQIRDQELSPRDFGLDEQSVEWVKAGANFVLPGLVDAHVHLNEPGRTDWEGFWTGTRAAASGGITTLVDMPLNSLPPTTTVPNLKIKRTAAQGQCHTDVAFWGGVIPDNKDHLKPLVAAGVRGFKCFLMDSGVEEFPCVTGEELRPSMKELEEVGSVLLFHAELETHPVQTKELDPREYSTFLKSRPPTLEINAISLVVDLQKEFPSMRCHIVHLSAASALPIIREAKSVGLPLTVETCFHYLCLNAEDIPAGHAEFKCCPPVREASNRDKLWDALKGGLIDCVVSDHSPCVISLKRPEDGDLMRAWGGISTLGLGLSLLWSEGQKRGASLVQIVNWTSSQPALHAGLAASKGHLKVGHDGDFILWDPDAEFEVTKDLLQYKNKVSPYEEDGFFPHAALCIMVPTRHWLLHSNACHRSRLSQKISWVAQRQCTRSFRPSQSLSQTRIAYNGYQNKYFWGRSPWKIYPTCAVIIATACFVAYQTSQPFRHTVLAVVRCSRVAGAAISSAIDYKITMAKNYGSLVQEKQAYSECHTRSAKKVLKALLANGGVFIKMGQHMASVFLLPIEWTSTMSVLQDRCEPTDYEDLKSLFLHDMGAPIEELFDDFDPIPIGVASLAQVHIGTHKASGKYVAVKLQHPHLVEFCDIDIKMMEATLRWVKYWFPDFEFTWLGDEMRTNLPKEMDFINEANNAARTVIDFADMKTSLYIPRVIVASKRVLIMEYIQGGRVDDLEYLASRNIDRNKVAIELSRIFAQMVFINGWFHADPHPGNLLIRRAPNDSRSPYNFEIVLLDHGLYFDMDSKLRVNYAKLWLSLIAPASPSTTTERRKYAKLVGNIGSDLYPVFEAAITGRVALAGSWEETEDRDFKRASSMVEMAPQTEAEKNAIRNAVMEQDGVLLSVFDVLRRVPRRIIMVLKLNDLTRSLDYALKTTHSHVRIFLVTAKYCTSAVWLDDRKRLFDTMKHRGLLSWNLLADYFSCWWRYKKEYMKLSLVEILTDFHASVKMQEAWLSGLWRQGFTGARDASFGLTG